MLDWSCNWSHSRDTRQFHGRDMLVSIFNALMGLPPVVVGLLVYLHLSRSGPFWLAGIAVYTPQAMVMVPVVLITPIAMALSCRYLKICMGAIKIF